MLRSDLCDCIIAYVAVKGRVTFRGNNNANRINKKLIFKNNVPFRTCISIINNRLVNNAQDLGTVMPIYNLLEYSKNYSMRSERLWNCFKD